ncbi:MAG: hypothetical protein LLG06_09675, partial [Desulfobacteraceae bacterium]|nr:hypothetical protein [Desulfobacteraceae bacterium]
MYRILFAGIKAHITDEMPIDQELSTAGDAPRLGFRNFGIQYGIRDDVIPNCAQDRTNGKARGEMISSAPEGACGLANGPPQAPK